MVTDVQVARLLSELFSLKAYRMMKEVAAENDCLVLFGVWMEVAHVDEETIRDGV